MDRISKDAYYLGICKAGAKRSTCVRRKFCAVIVKNDCILSMGYCGSPRGTLNCGLDIPCVKNLYAEQPLSYVHCGSVHAEKNAILNATRTGAILLDATMYLSVAEPSMKNELPCQNCRRDMIQVGLKECIWDDSKTGEIFHSERDEWIHLENKWMKDEIEQILGSEK